MTAEYAREKKPKKQKKIDTARNLAALLTEQANRSVRPVIVEALKK